MAWWKDARGLAATLFIAGTIAAGSAGDARADEAGDTKAAHEAYERGARAFGQGSYSVAATEFARADELRPDAAALESALKAAILADDPVLSMSLVERASGRPQSDRVAAQVARARDRHSEKVGRLSIVCAAPCSARVGSEVVPIGAARYYRAGNYVVEITAGGAVELFAVQLPAGANMEWKPPAKAPPVAESSSPSASAAPVATVVPTAGANAPSAGAPSGAGAAPLAPRASGLSPAWFGVGAGVTAVAGGLAIRFGVDTLGKHEAFVAQRTEAGAAAGRDVELKTNVFLGVTAATAIATAILGYLVFRSPPRDEARRLRTPPATAWAPIPLQVPQGRAPRTDAAAPADSPRVR